jgi:hypothetical protein
MASKYAGTCAEKYRRKNGALFGVKLSIAPMSFSSGRWMNRLPA